MKKVFKALKYLLLVALLSVLTYGTFRLEQISSVQRFFDKIRGVLNTEFTAIGALFAIAGITVFGIIYVRFHDKENDHKKNL